MKTIANSLKTMAVCFCLSLPMITNAQTVVVQTDPDNVEVYMNNVLVCQETPSIINIPKKLIGKPIIFKFKKEGYHTKSLTLSYTKKELKNNPVISCSLKKDNSLAISKNADAERKDPTIRKNEAQNRVTRDNAGNTALERTIIRWFFDTEPRGARIFWRVISSVPDEVKNTNETYLTTTPYEETRSFNILGLTYENARDVTIEVKVRKNGYEDQVKRFNVRQAIDQQEISAFFDLVKKDAE